ncbi:ankyrin repeat domain-containing protein [Wolbachia endosymbiont of Pentalonia nigronervosa]|uniref:ankyrin repeat domain-containing protein n=1 Tax=Wolbachia endosymbiont of Pentalonia nigronervosa TaxID=1301914 RepID=UPI00165EC003|nr:ankyrin repeat domain-containing protein [Wolbachia endosymbiont of Pentalonia nigronervosa]MBD0391449.1 ankyrin repeat domain-containing protein [Wolbachia endosymbiont of Pentalonia nigronervosa]
MFNAQQEINWYTILKKIIFDPGLTIENVLLEEDIKDINAVDLRGETILTTAIALSIIDIDIDIIKAIIKAGANINATIKHSTTIAEDENINTEHRKTALHCAVEANNPNLVQLLLKQGAKVDAVDQYGRTALHLAASYGCAEVVLALLEAGANVNAITTSGMKDTPLHQAAAFASVNRSGAHEKAQETIKILLMYGADISSTDRRGETPAVAAMDDDIGLFIEKAFNEVRSMKDEKIGTINGKDLSLHEFLKTDDKKQLLLYCSDSSIRNNIHEYLGSVDIYFNQRYIEAIWTKDKKEIANLS